MLNPGRAAAWGRVRGRAPCAGAVFSSFPVPGFLGRRRRDRRPGSCSHHLPALGADGVEKDAGGAGGGRVAALWSDSCGVLEFIFLLILPAFELLSIFENVCLFCGFAIGHPRIASALLLPAGVH